MSQYENPGPSTVVSLLRWRAEHQPGQLAYRFLNDGERDETRLSYGELDRAARAVAARLTEAGAAGERAVLLYPPGLDYLIAFYGCLYAGTVAVPAYPPDPARLDRSLRRLEAIVQDAQPLLTLTTAAHAGLLDLVAGRGPGPALPPVLATDGIAPGDAASWQPPAVGPGSTAFLQYTSGSTAVPRGVVLSHGNLLHNSGLIHRFFGSSDRTVAVAWLPPYHDMGLIGGIIQPLYGGFPITLMSPGHFLSRPLRWLEAVSRYGATTSGGPNFAYDLCVRKTTPAERATLDLSRWQVAFNGAEPVRPETLERFAAAFAPAGFRPDAFQPCYGLAEATLIATGGVAWTAGGTSAAARRLVSCGRTAPSQRVVVADPRTQAECAAGQEGEIWLTGPSVAQGYWSRPELSREVFGARLTGSGEGPFLRTGDLGLIRDGELYVTGRLKDLIVIRGRNHHPQDIEATAERSHPALRPGCGAAFTVAAGDPDGPVGAEQLVVAWELSPQAGEAHHGEVATAVRTAVAREHGLQVRTIVLLPRGGIPKTSSGKVQRGQCASLYAGGQLGGQRCDLPGPDLGAGRLDRAALRSAAPAQRRAQLTDYLCRQIATACGVAPDEVDPGRPLLALGADSIAVIAVGQAVEQDTGVTLPLSDLAGDGTVTDIAGRLAGELTAGTTDSAPQPADH
jgi:acyl-CoA synthetase (AMP-forming)/AMP-acid ligase II/acyl carrier protein